MRISRNKIRNLIRESIRLKTKIYEASMINFSGSNIEITSNGNIVIDDQEYKLTADRTGPDADVEVKDLAIVNGNLQIKAIGTLGMFSEEKTEILPPNKIEEIRINVQSGKERFTIKPAKPDGTPIIFTKLV